LNDSIDPSERSRCSSMNTLTPDGVNRDRPRKAPTSLSGSRSRGAARTPHDEALANLLALLAGRQIRTQALIRFDLTKRTYAAVSDRNPRSAATCAIGRRDPNTSRVAAPTAPPDTSSLLA
jgi:hypothetical protein